ncbi:MAG: hypothetical protein WCF88_12080 [Candidatus Acidiferrales bacterium]|jgi:hypothetical protein
MFCPECRAEYRPGFTRCSDCDVALVERLEETRIHSNKPEVAGAAELLWTGTDAPIRDGIIDALETAKIRYHARADKVGSLPGWSRQVFAIFTHTRDHQPATAALETAARRRETAPEDSDEAPLHSNAPLPESPESEDEFDASDVPPDSVPDDFDPEDATVEVWSGQDATTRENLVTCLTNIGIGTATSDSGGQLRIRVTPASQKRAQEMIRQVIDAS